MSVGELIEQLQRQPANWLAMTKIKGVLCEIKSVENSVHLRQQVVIVSFEKPSSGK
jgi:hypothetical protein